MNTFWKIFAAFILGIFLALAVYFLIMWRTTVRELKVSQLALYQCRHAPVKIDTIHDSIFFYNPIVFKPVPKPKPRDSSNVTVPNGTSPQIPFVEPKLCEESYDQVYKFSSAAGSGRIRWVAYIRNCKIEEMSFPEIVSPREIIHITKTVDTCLQKYEYKAITHFYAFGGLAINNFNSFPALQIGLGMSIKDQILFQPGVLYNPIDRKFYVQLSFGYFFR